MWLCSAPLVFSYFSAGLSLFKYSQFSLQIQVTTGKCFYCYKVILNDRKAMFFLFSVHCLTGPLNLSCDWSTRFMKVICLALISQNKGLKSPAGLARGSHPQICPCTSVQRLEQCAHVEHFNYSKYSVCTTGIIGKKLFT